MTKPIQRTILAVFIMLGLHVSAKKTTAILPLSWGNILTWDNGVPACGDSVIIPVGLTVVIGSHINLDENSSCSTPMYLNVSGTLHFTTGMKMYLPCNSFIDVPGTITKGTGWGSSNIIQICQTTVWSSDDDNVVGPASMGTPLPIELLAFDVNRSGDVAVITWTTASEINNDHFTVEKSRDGSQFVEVCRMAGAGNSRVIRNYTTYDKEIWSGYSYYRLKQTDYDGKFSYSELEVLQVSESFGDQLVQVVQGSGNGTVVIKLVEKFSGELMIYNTRGQEIYSQEVTNERLIPLEFGSNAVEAVYVLHLEGPSLAHSMSFFLGD